MTRLHLFAIARSLRWILAMAGAGAAASLALGAEPSRWHESFDFGWRFMQGDPPAAQQPAFDDAKWRKLNVPHDWSIEGAFDEKAPTGQSGGYLPAGVGWYRKHFQVPAELRGRRVTIQFDGIYANSDVWLNGRHLGRWPYGYSTFQYDLTAHLKFGGEPNVVAVRVDNAQQPASRWYTGSGIYRHVWLTATGQIHIPPWGAYVTTPAVSPKRATVRIRTRVRNQSAAEANLTLESQMVDEARRRVASVASEQTVGARGEAEFDQSVDLDKPELWSPATPRLYRVHSIVKRGAMTVDEYETTFGVRSIAYDANRGFSLNGQPTKMYGMCVHHDGGAVGAAVPEAVIERRLRLLKEMGCNAVRTAHNPMAPEFYDLCDRIGLLVMDEVFDEWTVRKPQLKVGYADYFAEWHERDAVNFIRRDRNHPSIVMWSAGNEIGDQLAPQGTEIVRKLVALFHREDPSRPVTAGLDFAYADRRLAPPSFTDSLDVAGYNYVDRYGTRRETYFADDRAAYPKRIFIGTEDTAVRGPRATYEFRALAPGTPARAAYATTMVQTAQLWKFALTHDYVIGHFMWVGIDYLGESPWPRRSVISGAIDTCGFPKDAFYFYQSLFSEKPMLHLFPHWNWSGREGQVVPVVAYTNCDVVELFLNGKSLGAKAREFPRRGAVGNFRNYPKPQVFPTTADVHLAWDALYAPGTVKAVGYVDGQVVCETEVRTAGAPAAVVLSTDRDTLRADARDVAHLTVEVVDAAGIMVPGADNLVVFEVEGAGALIGVDNGNPESHERFKGDRHRAFGGLCLALVQSTTRAGEIRVRASSEGLKGGALTLRMIPAAARDLRILAGEQP